MTTKNCTALAKFAVMSLFLVFLGSAAAHAQEAAARDSWRAFITHNAPQAEGCFRASYPNLEWEQMECKTVIPRAHPTPRSATAGKGGQTVGNTQDYVAESTGLITGTLGTFPTVTGVTSEKSVGVASFGGGGILGPNEYTLQINTNPNGTSSACAGIAGCTIWQQFVYATDYTTVGQATVYMQYWLLNWGSSACPSGYTKSGSSDCYTNSLGATAPDMAITSLASLSLSATAVASGNDTAVFNNGTTAYSVSAPDSMLDISQVWDQSEFNIFGDAGGSEAVFNTGSSVTVNVALTDGSTAAPICEAFAGSTGETNNLTLGICETASGSSPSIQFDEGNQPPTITSANHTTFTVGSVGMFQATGAGDPPTTYTAVGPRPNGIIFSPSGLLFGTPGAGTGGVYTFTITSSNGVAPNATQTFTLTVDQAPAITSGNSKQFTIGVASSFQVTATGFPAPTFSTGPLPSGITLSPSGLLGTTAAAGTAGTYHITIIASNGVSPNATQSFTITVVKASTACAVSTSSPLFTLGQPLTFTAYVTTSPLVVGSPSGKVSFIDATVSDLVLGQASLVGGTASIHAALTNPTHRQWIMVTYPGDPSFLPCKSTDIPEDLR